MGREVVERVDGYSGRGEGNGGGRGMGVLERGDGGLRGSSGDRRERERKGESTPPAP